jgi:hypothetical protein
VNLNGANVDLRDYREQLTWNERSIRLPAGYTQAVPRAGSDDAKTRIQATTLEQEIRKGGVGHNPSVEGGIVVMTGTGQLKIEPNPPAQAVQIVQPEVPAGPQHQPETSPD